MNTLRIGEISIRFIPQNFVDDSLFRKSLLFIKICEYLSNLWSKLWDIRDKNLMCVIESDTQFAFRLQSADRPSESGNRLGKILRVQRAET